MLIPLIAKAIATQSGNSAPEIMPYPEFYISFNFFKTASLVVPIQFSLVFIFFFKSHLAWSRVLREVRL